MVRLRSAPQAPVAQLDRALPSEGKGREFESRRVRHSLPSARNQRASFPADFRPRRESTLQLVDLLASSVEFGRRPHLGLDAPHGARGLRLPLRLDL